VAFLMSDELSPLADAVVGACCCGAAALGAVAMMSVSVVGILRLAPLAEEPCVLEATRMCTLFVVAELDSGCGFLEIGFECRREPSPPRMRAGGGGGVGTGPGTLNCWLLDGSSSDSVLEFHFDRSDRSISMFP
jgi:hypothetical protein